MTFVNCQTRRQLPLSSQRNSRSVQFCCRSTIIASRTAQSLVVRPQWNRMRPSLDGSIASMMTEPIILVASRLPLDIPRQADCHRSIELEIRCFDVRNLPRCYVSSPHNHQTSAPMYTTRYCCLTCTSILRRHSVARQTVVVAMSASVDVTCVR